MFLLHKSYKDKEIDMTLPRYISVHVKYSTYSSLESSSMSEDFNVQRYWIWLGEVRRMEVEVT